MKSPWHTDIVLCAFENDSNTNTKDNLSPDIRFLINTKGPVHLVQTNNKFVVVDDRSVLVVKLNRNCTVGEIVDTKQFTGGAGVIPDRQDVPHAHYVALTKCTMLLFVTDLGNDNIMQYKLINGKFTANGFTSTGLGWLPAIWPCTPQRP
ncbi:hypothetical protein H310_14914 [Aphanomyces invadans]|uniref:Cleavage/polyadenylation specificity factor A subunit N-terminal domain-containing protein n=1 Tax=Aphanomyces invadans TaxID=157072 RepID=A0A024T8G0_9STRA|nr:hypothetical protein H310_14914 [Aphanomyces invadans]ETV90259.1 hypothetical protein H310_14914 [Aphanomyces invadans]|eukprot:XP_008881110.1 hypothetical protein H310_14914 [Aphanomyces invadans]